MTQEQKEKLAQEAAYGQEVKQRALDYDWDRGETIRDGFQDGYYEGYLDALNARDEEVDKLEEQHEEDRLFVEEAERLLKFHRAFIEYLNDKAIGDKNPIIEAVYGNDLNCFEGYVKVTKTIENGKIMLEFERPSGDKCKAEWQPSDNYACWQTCGIMGDDYSGFLLFPTYKDDEYFCMYYTC